MRTIAALSLMCVPVILSSCSGGANSTQADAPKLINYAEKQKQDLAARGADMMSPAVDAVQGIPLTGCAGQDFSSGQDCIWNAGKAFDGLKLDVSGDAFSQGILGAPTKCSVEVRDEAGGKVTASSTVSFVPTGGGHYSATFPSIHCTKCISYDWTAPALRNGVTTVLATSSPIDGSCPPIAFKRGCAIQPAVTPIAVPIETQKEAAGTTTAAQAQDTAAKSQLELGELQSKAEQEERESKEQLEKEEKE
jgi:hypothetical protein